ncbi:MAG: nucleotidyltransferase family protein [Pseudomonadota bacterium]
MRLTDAQKSVIREEVLRHFGAYARPLLFGSRVDDNARGGDIDLYVEITDESSLLEHRLEFQRRLFHLFGDRKVDVVIHPRTRPQLPTHRIARKSGILLNGVQIT